MDETPNIYIFFLREEDFNLEFRCFSSDDMIDNAIFHMGSLFWSLPKKNCNLSEEEKVKTVTSAMEVFH